MMNLRFKASHDIHTKPSEIRRLFDDPPPFTP